MIGFAEFGKIWMVAVATILFASLDAADLDPSLIQTSGKPGVGTGKFYGYRSASNGPGDDAFADAYEKALSENVPLVVIWSNQGCSHCDSFAQSLNDEKKEVSEWLQTNKAVFAYFKDASGELPPAAGHKPKACYDAWNFVANTCGSQPVWPLVGFYYRGPGGKEVSWGHSVVSYSDKSFYYLKRNYENWIAKNGIGAYKGGTFGDVGGAGHRYEAEESTAAVDVGLVRDASDADEVWTNRFDAAWPDGTPIVSTQIVWAAGMTGCTVRVPLSRAEGAGFPGSGSIALSLHDGNGVWATNHIALLSGDEARDSASNPLWIGERFGFGEWTADLDAATNLVVRENGAGTVVSIQGSRWCPDCANVDRNFLDLEEGGKNRFKAWAASNKVALVSVDIPNFTGPSADDFATPSIFSRKAYRTTLARAREWPASGADASLTNAMLRSGLGYLSRKGIDDAMARVYFGRNHRLASSDTDRGGFHRPEDSNRNRTGVPVFVVLRRDGTVAARLTQMASTSPMASDRGDFGNYIKRFDEMLAVAADSGPHADSAEIANNHPHTTPLKVVSTGGLQTNELCHADSRDVFLLSGAGGGTAQKVAVRGDSDAEISVSFIVEDSGTIETVASKSGNLRDGVELDCTFSGAPRCYVQVSGGFAIAEAKEMDFHRYSLSADSLLVPTETTAVASAPEGLGYVLMRVASNVLYRVEGIASGVDGVFVKAGDGLYRALKTCDVRLATTEIGGSVEYQIWRPGEIAFEQDVFSVLEYAVSGTVSVVRRNGSAGEARVRIGFADGQPEDDRFGWAGEELVWADGESGVRTVALPVTPNGVYDEEKSYALALLPLDPCFAEVSAAQSALVIHDTTSPCFGQTSYAFDANLGFETVLPFSVYNISNAATLAVSVARASGPLPPGLAFSVDVTKGAVSLSGVPSTPGSYAFTVTLSEKRGGKAVAGFETVITIAVADRSSCNPRLGTARKNQTVPLFVRCGEADIVAGTLTLAVTRSNRISAKYAGTESGTVAFTGNWQAIDAVTGTVSASFESKGAVLALSMNAAGTVAAELEVPSGRSCFAEGDSVVFGAVSPWPQSGSFAAYEGNYNVTFPREGAVPASEPSGTGFMALKMTTAPAVRSGMVRYAGWLPDGSAVSGSAKLVPDAHGSGRATLPVFRRMSRNVFSAALEIAADAVHSWDDTGDPFARQVVNAADGTVAFSLHRDPKWTYSSLHGAYGSYYVPYVSPAGLVALFYGPGYTYSMAFDAAAAMQSDSHGALAPPGPFQVLPGERKLALAGATEGLTFSYSPMTGVFSGSGKLVFGDGKSTTGYYRGIVIPGWSDCGCGLDDVTVRPFGSGTFKFRDTSGGKTVVRSIAVDIDKD